MALALGRDGFFVFPLRKEGRKEEEEGILLIFLREVVSCWARSLKRGFSLFFTSPVPSKNVFFLEKKENAISPFLASGFCVGRTAVRFLHISFPTLHKIWRMHVRLCVLPIPVGGFVGYLPFPASVCTHSLFGTSSSSSSWSVPSPKVLF